jgi:hypothetical protein
MQTWKCYRTRLNYLSCIANKYFIYDHYLVRILLYPDNEITGKKKNHNFMGSLPGNFYGISRFLEIQMLFHHPWQYSPSLVNGSRYLRHVSWRFSKSHEQGPKWDNFLFAYIPWIFNLLFQILVAFKHTYHNNKKTAKWILSSNFVLLKLATIPFIQNDGNSLSKHVHNLQTPYKFKLW